MATKFSIKHAIPSDTLGEIVGVVTVSDRVSGGFDHAQLIERNGIYVWYTGLSRDGRNGKQWDGSDVVNFNRLVVWAGSCKLIDSYDNSDKDSLQVCLV
jgi:hypothetical protein